jgi:hypothetical protein
MNIKDPKEEMSRARCELEQCASSFSVLQVVTKKLEYHNRKEFVC